MKHYKRVLNKDILELIEFLKQVREQVREPEEADAWAQRCIKWINEHADDVVIYEDEVGNKEVDIL